MAKAVTSCTMPGFAIREVYWGREFLERTLFQRGVHHDGLGDPVFDQRGPLFGRAPEPDIDEDE